MFKEKYLPGLKLAAVSSCVVCALHRSSLVLTGGFLCFGNVSLSCSWAIYFTIVKDTSSFFNHLRCGYVSKHTKVSKSVYCTSQIKTALDNVVMCIVTKTSNSNKLMAWPRLENFSNTMLFAL